VSGHKVNLLPGCYHHPGFPLQQLPGHFDEGPLAVDRGGVHLHQGKAQFVNFDQLLFSGDDLGLDRGLFGLALGQVGASARSSVAFPWLPLPSRCMVMVLTGFVAAFLNAAPLLS
jgi:hypothetical protein